MIKLSISPFRWTTEEQVYPLLQGNNGETVYGRRIDINPLPATVNNWTTVASVPYITNADKVVDIQMLTGSISVLDAFMSPGPSPALQTITVRYNSGIIEIFTAVNYNTYKGQIRILYTK